MRMKNNKGSIIVFALIVLSFVLIAAFSVAAVTLVERRSANVSVNSATAFQNADKGMEAFLQQLYKELDQNDTLDDMAAALGSGYSCAEGGGDVPAYIGGDGSSGNAETEFIISAYREVTPDPNDPAGWRSVEAITECDTALADVSRFKAAGNFNNAARAVFLKLRDSLSRGLVAHWSLEDRAQVARLELDQEDKNSFIAQDSSKQNHVMTLCSIKSDSSPIPVELLTDGEDNINFSIEEFADCGLDQASGMDPYRGYGDSDDPEYSATGAWVEGIVEEELVDVDGTNNALGDDSTDEALYFDGNTYLAMYTDASCDDDVINCVNEIDDQLQVDEGLSISMWIKPDATSGIQYLLSREEDSTHKYNLYLDGEKLYFDMGNRTINTENKIDTDWHHIVGRWGEDESDTETVQLLIDGVELASNSAGSYTAPSSLLRIGADSTGAQNFVGTIDDVRIWNRRLTDSEVCRLCWEAGEDAQNNVCDATCDLTN